jgi:hypothetical protein
MGPDSCRCRCRTSRGTQESCSSRVLPCWG